MRRAPLAAGVVLLLIAVALAGWRTWSQRDGACHGDDQVVSSVPDAFDDAPDPRLARLVEATQGWGLGEVVAKVGYDYNQYLYLAALPGGGLGVQTRGSRFFGLLGPDLTTRWGLKYAAGRHTWDLGPKEFVSVHRPDRAQAEITSHRFSDGEVRWCRALSDRLADDDSLATLTGSDGSAVVLAGERLTRLAGRDGRPTWQRRLPVEGADALLGPWEGVLAAGPTHPVESGPVAIVGVEEQTGRTAWERRGSGSTSIVGAGAAVLVIQHRGPEGTRLIGLDPTDGTQRWRSAAGAEGDAAVRGGVVLLRGAQRLQGFDAETRKPLWDKAIRQQPQAFPYGFELDAQPMLDDDTLLMGATDALVELDLGTGAQRRHALPTDGINTTFWPYQVVVSANLIGVVTNTGAVVLRR